MKASVVFTVSSQPVTSTEKDTRTRTTRIERSVFMQRLYVLSDWSQPMWEGREQMPDGPPRADLRFAPTDYGLQTTSYHY